MVVRVRVALRREGRVAETSALANSGYESDRPEIHVPLGLARRLGFSLEHLRSERYSVVGAEVSAYMLGEVEVRVVAEKPTRWVKAGAVVVPGEYEVILSDTLMEELEIELIKPRTGLWRLTGEEKSRPSAPAEYWP